MPLNIDPNAAEEREMQQRGQNLQFAGQLMLKMMEGRADMTVELSPEKLFGFAIGVAEQMQIHFNSPTKASTLVS